MFQTIATLHFAILQQDNIFQSENKFISYEKYLEIININDKNAISKQKQKPFLQIQTQFEKSREMNNNDNDNDNDDADWGFFVELDIGTSDVETGVISPSHVITIKPTREIWVPTTSIPLSQERYIRNAHHLLQILSASFLSFLKRKNTSNMCDLFISYYYFIIYKFFMRASKK
jgi:hypothetical protein